MHFFSRFITCYYIATAEILSIQFPFGENEDLFGEDVKFKIQVEVFNKKVITLTYLTLTSTTTSLQLANEEKISRIEMLMDSSGGALPFKGAVSLNR